jgi:N-acetylglucosaminyl-diphospho-decaprenol L-rhamnosyltransferase
MIDLSLIIVSWNVRSFLAGCLDTIKAHTGTLNLEVIVVDSGSTDGTVDLLRAGYPWVRLLAQNDNIGFTRGCNLGLAAAQGRHMMLLNPDTEISDDVLSRLVRYLDEHPDAGIVGPRTLNADGTTQHTRRRFPTFRTFLYDSPSLYRYTPNEVKHCHYVLDIADTAISDVDWVQGSALMIRRQVFEQIGALDTGYVMFYEEADWCNRAQVKGWRVVYFGEAAILHYGGRSTSQVPVIKQICYHRSKLRYAWRYQSPAASVVLRAVLVISYIHQVLLEFLKTALGRRRLSHYQRLGVNVQVILALCLPGAIQPFRTKIGVHPDSRASILKTRAD